jgi:hypothetical protein
VIEALVIKACLVDGCLDFFVPLVKAGVVGINGYKQPDGFIGMLLEVSARIGKASEHKRESAIASSWLDPNATKQSLENRTKQPLLLDVLAEQRTPEVVWHVMPRGLQSRTV